MAQSVTNICPHLALAKSAAGSRNEYAGQARKAMRADRFPREEVSHVADRDRHVNGDFI